MKKFFSKIANYDNGEEEKYEDEEMEENPEEENEDEEYEEEYDNSEETEEAEEETEADQEPEEERAWLGEAEEEGQLSIDVYQTTETIVVKSTIAGVKPEDIDISVNNDLLTIRGRRDMMEKIKDENYLFKECYWGSFSRSIILPVEIIPEKIEATLENGVLTVILPKAKSSKSISIKVKSK